LGPQKLNAEGGIGEPGFSLGFTFFLKKVDDLFSRVVALKTQAANAADCFTVKIKQMKRSGMVTFLFSVHTITEAKQ